jgi:hypothetical protein
VLLNVIILPKKQGALQKSILQRAPSAVSGYVFYSEQYFQKKKSPLKTEGFQGA